jgi:hypothetical protein
MDLDAAAATSSVERPDHEHTVTVLAELLDLEIEDIPDVGVPKVGGEPLGPVVRSGLDGPGPSNPLEVVSGQRDEPRKVPAIERGNSTASKQNGLRRSRIAGVLRCGQAWLPRKRGWDSAPHGPAPMTQAAALGRPENASDGTRTRDLRRDRPAL